MNKKQNTRKFKFLLHDIAESVSRNEESAERFFEEENIDIDKYVSKGLEQINALVKENKETKDKKKTVGNKSNLFFRRAVLAAEIASNLHNEPTFGHVKFQKLVYLSEQICAIESDNRYTKQAAGPFDRIFMHSIDTEFKRQKWFEVKKEKVRNYQKYKYTPLENSYKYKKYYNSYFSRNDKTLQWLIDTFRKSTTDTVELIATIYYCWKEILETNETFSNELIIDKFYKWSKEKKKFSVAKIESGIDWMKENKLVPEL